jgi:hypothetical protein
MSLEASFERLRTELGRLQEAVSALHVTVAEDKPAHGEAVLVDWVDNTVTDLLGLLEEAADALSSAPENAQHETQLTKTRTRLRLSHELMTQFIYKFMTELAAHDSIARLLEMAGERGRAWQQWVKVVKTAIERCTVPLRAVNSAILDCWHELSEILARNSVSVQATNIGQQITVREDQLEWVSKAG